ncbi:MAG TPA: hypothetical protein EYN00_09245, partial [Planctomycetes bacterium]|nr:hypothetical protein [Planctomycetota bacterium]
MSEKRTRLLLGSFKIAALLLAFSWFQGEIRSTRVEADASTHGLRLAHDRVQTRITDLERTRETSLSTLIDTIDRLEVFQEGIVASDLRFEEDRVAI